MRILFIDTVHHYLWDSLVANGHQCVDGTTWSREKIKMEIKEYHGIVIRSRITIDAEILAAASGLKFIARAGAGMESINVEDAIEKGIVCINSPEGNRDAVGEHAIGMLLSLLNNLNRGDREMRTGKWIREGNRGHELGSKTVAIIGYGNMGFSFAEKLSGFGCMVIAYDKYKSGFSNHYIEECTMDDIFKRADIVSLHVPLTAETNYLVNDSFINKFSKNIYLVNTARGKCVKTDDLVKNIQSGKVIGACLDVLEYEDTSFENFSSKSDFQSESAWQFLIHSDKVILSPHVAGWTFESHEKISKVLFEKIRDLDLNKL